MIANVLIIYLIAGIFVGLCSGLFGAGGGIISVPVLLFVFLWQGYNEAYIMSCVVGTSLGIMLFTSLISIYAHHQLNNIKWSYTKQLLPAISIGVFLGAFFNKMLPSAIIQILFAAIIVLAVLKVIFKRTSSIKRNALKKPGTRVISTFGLSVGTISAMIGIGGSIITVPVFRGWNFTMRHAIGTALVCSVPVSLFGVITYTVIGLIYPSDLPYGSLGDVNWLAVLCIVIPSMATARIGSKLATIVPDRTLKYAYVSLLSVIGAEMVSHVLF